MPAKGSTPVVAGMTLGQESVHQLMEHHIEVVVAESSMKEGSRQVVAEDTSVLRPANA